MAAKKPQQTPLVCHGHSRPIVDLSYSAITPDGYFLTSASKDGQPMLRNGSNGDWVGTFQGHKGAVWQCVLNKPALLAATASADFSARIWDAVSGDVKHTFPDDHIVRSVHFSQDSNHLLTAGYDKANKMKIYDLANPSQEPQHFQAADSVRFASYHSTDNLILSTYVDKPNISVWDIRSQQVVKTLETSDVVLSLEIVNSNLFITADGKTVKLWDANSFKVIKSFTLPHKVESASYSPEKRKFAAGGEDMWVHLYDFDSGDEIDCNRGHHGPVHCVRFAPDGHSYASGSEDGTIRIWDTEFSSKHAADMPAATANGVAHPL